MIRKYSDKLMVIATFAILLFSMIGCALPKKTVEFHSAWSKDVERIWVGQEYWANPLQDWRIANGRLECITSGPDRNVHLLTRQMGKQRGNLLMSVRLGRIDKNSSKSGYSWVGFRIGAKGKFGDYRDNVRRGEGLDVGILPSGELFIGGFRKDEAKGRSKFSLDDIELRLAANPSGRNYNLTVGLYNTKTGKELKKLSRENISADQLIGNLVIVCNKWQFWFRDWKVSGSKVEVYEEHVFGPILFSQYTLSKGVLKMTAQMPPIGEKDSQTVRLEVRRGNSRNWRTIGEAKIDKHARTATFRIENWDASRDIPYRLVYSMIDAKGKLKDYYWGGTIRHDPVDKETVVVAAFTGNADYRFPNTDIVEHVKAHNPDVLFFSGDQIYQNVGGYGVQRTPLEKATLDYLRKWYFWGWAFRDLTRNRPTICIPDDHDVYQGNLWGEGGRKMDKPNAGKDDRGGYRMPAEWVKMVERTQTSHLPDPYDPTPVEQGIGVYYCEMNYGRISFAILEDRKFKSGPAGLVPKTKSGRADHVVDPNFDPRTADVPGGKLLGSRQLNFLKDWAADWRRTDMKVALSQTTLAGAVTTHGGGKMRLIADYDSNGWPQTGRNKALRELRRGFAFHICGDQHLAMIIHHGIDDWNDAGWSLSVPSIANLYPRAWEPLKPGKNRKEGMPPYTGEFLDGFGNHITVWAVANPHKVGHTGPFAKLDDRAPGYGIVRLNKKDRTITMEIWPPYVDPTDPRTGGQYSGWPKTIKQTDNYGRKANGYLPTIKVSGMASPVVQIIDEENGEIVYTLRIKGDQFRPKVFKEGSYTIRIGDPDSSKIKILRNIHSVKSDEDKIVMIEF